MSGTDILVFGEVLFDCFDDDVAVLGGAPFNVAWHLRAFGHSPRFVSRIGDDAYGHRVRAAMRDWGMPTAELQTDEALPTGTVSVTLHGGEPRYEIRRPAAWDAIAAHGNAPTSGILYHGTLALRDERSRAALDTIRARHSGIVLVDVNLRDPWWTREAVMADLQRATWAKLNDAELERLWPSASPEDYLSRFGLEGLVLTHGAAGAEILTADGRRVRVEPHGAVAVVDSVGAGDAFSAVIISGLARAWPLELSAERAQRFAAAILGRRGATVRERAFYEAILADWEYREGD